MPVLRSTTEMRDPLRPAGPRETALSSSSAWGTYFPRPGGSRWETAARGAQTSTSGVAMEAAAVGILYST